MISKLNNEGLDNSQCRIDVLSNMGHILNTYSKYYRLCIRLKFFEWAEQTERDIPIAIMNEAWKYHLEKKFDQDRFQTICIKFIGLKRFGEYLISRKDS